MRWRNSLSRRKTKTKVFKTGELFICSKQARDRLEGESGGEEERAQVRGEVGGGCSKAP
jgi:hypothetical protein